MRANVLVLMLFVLFLQNVRSAEDPQLTSKKLAQPMVETDQETSLVQAVRKYVSVTKDRAFLQEQVAGKTVLDRLELALEYLFNERFDSKHGLISGATSVDWGDVQPEHEWGVELDDSSHRAIDISAGALGQTILLLNAWAQENI